MEHRKGVLKADLNAVPKVGQTAVLKEATSGALKVVLTVGPKVATNAVRKVVLIADRLVDTRSRNMTSQNTKSASRAEKKVLTRSHDDVDCSETTFIKHKKGAESSLFYFCTSAIQPSITMLFLRSTQSSPVCARGFPIADGHTAAGRKQNRFHP